MSYGILLKNANTNQTETEDSISFSAVQRGNISTSAVYYFSTFGFNAKEINLNVPETGSLLGDNGDNFSFIDFNLNQYDFYGVAANTTRPTVIEICKIHSYEIGVGQTVFSDDFTTNKKYIKNFNAPSNIFSKQADYPAGIQTSYFQNALNYINPASGVENFLYVTFDGQNPRYFLATPGVVWKEIPNIDFYQNTDYFLTINSTAFDGSKLELNSFSGVIPKRGNTILIKNNLNTELSGVYSIENITDYVYLSRGNLKFNFPGQSFESKVDLDKSNSLNYNSIINYIPFSYGYAAECFTKPLPLVEYTSSSKGTSGQYPPLFRDAYDFSALRLKLSSPSSINQVSDSFQLGVFVSTWCPDSKLILGAEISINSEG